MWTAETLRAFEAEVAGAFERGEIHAPIHLSGGNEAQLLELFREVREGDWVFSTWRSHYHALLKGIPRAQVMAQILQGKSMFLSSPEHNFFSSAMVGGCLPIACGVARRHRTWVFVGDMTASTGTFHDAVQFAAGHNLPITFVVEDNGLSTNTPTEAAWGSLPFKRWDYRADIRHYKYERLYPHYSSRSSQHDSGKF